MSDDDGWSKWVAWARGIDAVNDAQIRTMEGLARRICTLEARVEALVGKLDNAAAIDRLNRRLDELEAESKDAEARPAPPPLRLAAP